MGVADNEIVNKYKIMLMCQVVMFYVLWLSEMESIIRRGVAGIGDLPL